MRRLARKALRRFGFDLVRFSPDDRDRQSSEFAALPDLTQGQKDIILAARPFTMTSAERMTALINAVTYIVENGVAGDITECGVWRGGSMMTIALTLLSLGDRSRTLYLYDTFEGMSDPTTDDKSLDGALAAQQLNSARRGTGVWCYASIDDVRTNLLSTGYPKEKIHLIQGKVEDTIPATLPGRLALLRLDTDWYESTKHELIHLYPLLNPTGILVIDDYGHWQGAKKAVDEYFRQRGERIFLHRIDYTGRLVVKGDIEAI